MLKLQKVHIALLTNVTEGKVKNEHITMYYSKEVTAKTVLKRMNELNKQLPVDMFNLFEQYPMRFKSWSGEVITAFCSNGYWNKQEPFATMFKDNTIHITLVKNQSEEGFRALYRDCSELNWDEGLKIGECHVGWKENGEMVYRTEAELIDWIANNAGN